MAAFAANPPAGSAAGTMAPHAEGCAQASAAARRCVDGLGPVVSTDTLEHSSGGTNTSNIQNLSGVVTGNSATQVDTGSNSVSSGAFSGAVGLPTVIQNTGNNVLIQSGVIVNVQFKP
ncbi:hypothetical protein [Rhodanobacter geophilus]|uniref:Uncharacterized protein n=1 Tax=Rhodanobacter geophilus TaxID=3162488 RepID=A0ABV3QKT1_9GAMM